MLKVLSLSFASFYLATGAAQAGSADEMTPDVLEMAVSAPDWSGAYAGAFGGTSSGNYLNGVSSADQFGVDIEMGGTVFGAKAGYSFQDGNMVYGIEADIGTGPTGLTPQGSIGPYWRCISGDCYANIDLLASVRGRVGFATSADMLIYGTAGIGYAQVTGGILNSGQDGGGSATGIVYGGGAEYAVGTNSTIGAEYLFYDISPIPFGSGGGGTIFDGVGSFGIIRAFFNFRF